MTSKDLNIRVGRLFREGWYSDPGRWVRAELYEALVASHEEGFRDLKAEIELLRTALARIDKPSEGDTTKPCCIAAEALGAAHHHSSSETGPRHD